MTTENPAPLFYRNPYLLALTIVIAVVAGMSAAFSMPRIEDPRIVNRNPLVVTPFPGASATRVESLVTEVLETKLEEIPEISKLESTSRAGVSVLALEFEAATTTERSEQLFGEIRDKLAEAERDLPEDAGTPLVDDQRQAVAFTLIVGVTQDRADTDQLGLLDRVAEELADRLRQIRGTELVRTYGAPDEEITVRIDERELTGLGLTIADVAAATQAADAKGPAGIIRGERASLLMEVAGEFDTVARVAEVPIAASSTQFAVRLGDVAHVERSIRTPSDEIARVDGKRGIFVAARVGVEQQVDLWMRDANEALAAFERETGPGVVFERVFEQAAYTSERLGELGSNLLAGAGVVVAVVFLMMGWRQSLIVALALPLVVGLVLFSMQALGIRLHQISVFGLIIALGLLIDNAIVVTDEVSKELEQGRSRPDAVARTLRHLAGPLLASTLTTVLAFAPIMLLPGNAGDFVGSIGQTVVLALVFSLAIALTVTAALAGRFAAAPARNPAADRQRSMWQHGFSSPWLASRWRRVATALYRAPAAAILLALILPTAGFGVSRALGSEFFPPVDRNMFQVEVWLPNQASINYSERNARAIEAAIRDEPDVERIDWLIGGSFPTVYYNLAMNKDLTPSYAQAVVVTGSAAATKRLIAPLQAKLDRAFPGSQIVIRKFGQGPPVLADVQYRVFGPSVSGLQQVGEQLQTVLQSHPDVLTTKMSLSRGEPKLWVVADEERARLAGLSLVAIAAELDRRGEGQPAGSLIEDLEQLPVRVRTGDRRRASIERVAASQFAAGDRSWLPLDAIATLELRPEPSALSRYGGHRCNVIDGYTRQGALPIDVATSVLRSFQPPPGYSIRMGGAAEADAEATGNLMLYVPVLATLTIATLILSFGSVALCGVLLAVAALSVGLGQLATWSMGFPVSFNTILGTLGLIGVALNDSIVVLATIRSEPRARAGDPAAVAAAVMSCTRHVLSTTLTTVGGFLPLLLFVGGDFWPSLAIVMCGGILGASLLAILLVPGLYVLGMRGLSPADDGDEELIALTY